LSITRSNIVRGFTALGGLSRPGTHGPVAMTGGGVIGGA